MSKFFEMFKDMNTVKSYVRVMVTYAATLFIFGGGAWLMYAFLNASSTEELANAEGMKEIYMTIFPVATGIVTYWFATRSNSKTDSTDPAAGNDQKGTPSTG